MQLRRLLWLGLGLLLALGTARLWPHRALLLDPQALVDCINQLGHWQEVAFLAAHVVAAVFALPGAVVAIAGGALFGTLWGTVWSVLGATGGAAIAFRLARSWGQPWCQRQFHHHQRPTRGAFGNRLGTSIRPGIAWLNQRLQTEAFWYVLTLRLTPISPFSLMNVLLGLTSVRFMPYLGGTLVGIVPGTLAYTWLGAAGFTALRGGAVFPLSGALGLLALLSVLPLALGRKSDSL